MRLIKVLFATAIGVEAQSRWSDNAEPIVNAVTMIAQSHEFIASGINGWSGKFMDFIPVRFEMHVINRLIKNGTSTAEGGQDLTREDSDKVMGAIHELADITDSTMDTFIQHALRFKVARLDWFVVHQLRGEQRLSLAFAEAVVSIAPSFGREVEMVLGKHINEAYQRAVDTITGGK